MDCVLFAKMDRVSGKKNKRLKKIFEKWTNILESQGILSVRKSGNHEVDCQEGDRKVKILLCFCTIVGVDCQLVLNKINQTKEDRKWGNKYVYRKIPAVPQVWPPISTWRIFFQTGNSHVRNTRKIVTKGKQREFHLSFNLTALFCCYQFELKHTKNISKFRWMYIYSNRWGHWHTQQKRLTWCFCNIPSIWRSGDLEKLLSNQVTWILLPYKSTGASRKIITDAKHFDSRHFSSCCYFTSAVFDSDLKSINWLGENRTELIRLNWNTDEPIYWSSQYGLGNTLRPVYNEQKDQKKLLVLSGYSLYPKFQTLLSMQRNLPEYPFDLENLEKPQTPGKHENILEFRDL